MAYAGKLTQLAGVLPSEMDVTFEDAERASCYLAIVEEVRRTMLELCSAEKMYDMK